MGHQEQKFLVRAGKGDDDGVVTYIKGDSIIVMAIDTIKTGYDLQLRLPAKVTGGIHLKSTGNETDSLCQEIPITLDEPTDVVTVPMPARSLDTYILFIDRGAAAIEPLKIQNDANLPKTYYDLQGRRLDNPHGLCIERTANGRSKKVFIK